MGAVGPGQSFVRGDQTAGWTQGGQGPSELWSWSKPVQTLLSLSRTEALTPVMRSSPPASAFVLL